MSEVVEAMAAHRQAAGVQGSGCEALAAVCAGDDPAAQARLRSVLWFEENYSPLHGKAVDGFFGISLRRL